MINAKMNRKCILPPIRDICKFLQLIPPSKLKSNYFAFLRYLKPKSHLVLSNLKTPFLASQVLITYRSENFLLFFIHTVPGHPDTICKQSTLSHLIQRSSSRLGCFGAACSSPAVSIQGPPGAAGMDLQPGLPSFSALAAGLKALPRRFQPKILRNFTPSAQTKLLPGLC